MRQLPILFLVRTTGVRRIGMDGSDHTGYFRPGGEAESRPRPRLRPRRGGGTARACASATGPDRVSRAHAGEMGRGPVFLRLLFYLFSEANFDEF